MQDETLQRLRKAVEFASANDMRVTLADLHGATLEVSPFAIRLLIFPELDESGFTEEITELTVVAKVFALAFIVETKG